MMRIKCLLILQLIISETITAKILYCLVFQLFLVFKIFSCGFFGTLFTLCHRTVCVRRVHGDVGSRDVVIRPILSTQTRSRFRPCVSASRRGTRPLTWPHRDVCRSAPPPSCSCARCCRFRRPTDRTLPLTGRSPHP